MADRSDAPPPGTGSPEQALAEVHRRFIERWSQMASSWGVPRSMAEVHALLFVEARPVSADEIMQRLGISRGNASMTVRTLEEWGIVRRESLPDERRDYFVAERDALALFATVMRVRKEREIDPLLALVSECRAAAAAVPAAGDGSAARAARDLDDPLLALVSECRAAAAAVPAAGDGSAARAARDLDDRLADMDLFVRAIDAMACRYLSHDGSGLRTLAAEAGVER